MNIKKHIPNFLTCCNLLCGCIGIVEASQLRLENASYLIFIACIFDFFDGFAARLLKVSSPIGKELDSLADVVTFGILPSIIFFQLINHAVNIDNISPLVPNYFYLHLTTNPIAYTAFLIAIFSALRLAKFNIDTRQSDSFIGVPTPANAILLASFPLILPAGHLHNTTYNMVSYSWLAKTIADPYFLIVLTILMSYLLVAELPLFALKFKNFKWSGNQIRYIFLALSIMLLAIFYFTAIPIIIFLYIALSIVENKIIKTKSSML